MRKIEEMCDKLRDKYDVLQRDRVTQILGSSRREGMIASKILTDHSDFVFLAGLLLKGGDCLEEAMCNAEACERGAQDEYLVGGIRHV